MAKIIFWNIQRAKGALVNDISDNLKSDLAALVELYAPDIIVLCEGAKGLRKNMRGGRGFEAAIPQGYEAPKFIKTHGDYKKETTLRYVAMNKSTIQCSYYLVGTEKSPGSNFSRPGLLICFNNLCLVAMHAPSITGSTVMQCRQISTIYSKVTDLAQQNLLTINQSPSMFFGDMNMNVALGKTRGKIRGKVGTLGGQQFQVKRTDDYTHRNANTGNFDTKLDWALANVGIQCTVTAIQPTPIRIRKVVNKKKRKRDQYNDNSGFIDDDYSGEDSFEGSDDDDYTVKFRNRKDADHLPILISW